MAPKPKTYTAPKVDHVIEIHDFDIDLDRKYTVVPRTRSVNRAKRDLIDEIRELEPAFLTENDGRDDLTDDEEDAIARKICDLINLLTHPPAKEDVPTAGDLLYTQWENDQALDEHVAYYAMAVLGLDPSPAPN